MQVQNETPFAADRYAVTDLDGADLLVAVLKATYIFDTMGKLEVSDDQLPIELVDRYAGEPGESSVVYASDFSINKPGTDVAVLGHAYPVRTGDREVNAGIEVGNKKNLVRVFGDRFWGRSMGISRMSAPRIFDRIPLVFERSFGGADKSHPEERYHEFESRNPVGVGFRARKSKMAVDEAPLPNIEDPRTLISGPYDRPAPGGLGFIGPTWQPRLGFAGTYDEVWEKTRKPLLPVDFSPHFFNAAHPDLVCKGYLNGDEEVTAIGVSPDGPINFNLPGAKPSCTIERLNFDALTMALRLDKVVLMPDERRLLLVWIGALRIPGTFQDIDLVQFTLQT